MKLIQAIIRPERLEAVQQALRAVLDEDEHYRMTVQTVEAACAEAKAAKPNEVIGLGYVAAILTRWAADASKIDAGRAVPPAERRAAPRRAHSFLMRANS